MPADPVNTDPEGPTLPEGTPAWTRGEPWCEPQPDALFDITHLTLVVSGSPGATVRAEIYPFPTSDSSAQIVLDAAGNGTIDLRPSIEQLLLPIVSPSSVHLMYVLGDRAGPAEPFPLTELYDDLDCAIGWFDEDTVTEVPVDDLEAGMSTQAETFSVETSVVADDGTTALSIEDAADEPEAPSPPLPAESLPAETTPAPPLEAPAPEGELAPAEAAAPAE